MRAIRVGLLVVWVAVVVVMAGCADEPQAPEPPRKDLRVPTVVRGASMASRSVGGALTTASKPSAT